MKLWSNNNTAEELRQLATEKELHVRKGQVFYDRKSKARQAAQCSNKVAAIAFDFQKNLSCPNITTNDVYYRRQLSLYSFNIHNLGNDSVHLYCYDETFGRKGADDVTSMLYHYFMDVLPAEVNQLELFCDGCAGQNKNWTMRFLHNMVCTKKRFEQVKISFPIRGHSYMECDRDMVCINQKTPVETPNGWLEVFRSARKNPSPYNVVEVESNNIFLNMTEFLKPYYRASCPIQTRPLREIVFSQQHAKLMQYRESWNGPFDTAVISKQVGRKTTTVSLTPLYNDRLPITKAKYDDLQVLKRFCNTEAQQYYDNLPQAGDAENTDSDSSD